MIFDFNSGRRLPDGFTSPPWIDLFHRCRRDEPLLFQEMHDVIGGEICGPRYAFVPPAPPDAIPNSSWLGAQLLQVFPRMTDWNTFCRHSLDASRGLFNQIMWNVMALDNGDWLTVVTSNANLGRMDDERVYWLRGAPRARQP